MDQEETEKPASGADSVGKQEPAMSVGSAGGGSLSDQDGDADLDTLQLEKGSKSQQQVKTEEAKLEEAELEGEQVSGNPSERQSSLAKKRVLSDDEDLFNESDDEEEQGSNEGQRARVNIDDSISDDESEPRPETKTKPKKPSSNVNGDENEQNDEQSDRERNSNRGKVRRIKEEEAVDVDDNRMDISREHSDVESQSPRARRPAVPEFILREVPVLNPRSDLSQSKDRVWTKLPMGILFESNMFKPDTFQPQDYDVTVDPVTKKEKVLVRGAVVRWRTKPGVDFMDAVSKKIPAQAAFESNARVLRWSDGSITMQIGKEVFNVKEYEFTAPERQQLGVLFRHKKQFTQQFEGRVNHQWAIQPTSLQSEGQRSFALVAETKFNRKKTIELEAPEMAPEVQEERNAYVEQQKARQQQKMENERRRREQRLLEQQTKRGLGRVSEAYLEDREFDEEEEGRGRSRKGSSAFMESRAERAKRRRKARKTDSDEDESEDYDELGDEEEEEEEEEEEVSDIFDDIDDDDDDEDEHDDGGDRQKSKKPRNIKMDENPDRLMSLKQGKASGSGNQETPKKRRALEIDDE